jgi:hypothetical protein
LKAVYATASNDVWAVGYQATPGGFDQTLTLHWDGTAWSRILSLSNPTRGERFAGGVAFAANDAWAVGSSGGGPSVQSIMAHWDGSQWQAVVPPSSGDRSYLQGAARAGADLWAVGGFYQNGGRYETLTERYHTPCNSPTPAPASPTSTSTPTPVAATPAATNTATAVAATPPATTTPVPPSRSATPSVSSTPCTTEFVDVPMGSTFYSAIRCLACRGIISGYPCGGPGEPCPGAYFRPGNHVTRGQTAKIVAAAAAHTELIPSTQQTFADIAPDSTFWVWIERLASRGLISGYPCGGVGEPCTAPANRPYFRPNNNVTRGQLSKIVAGAAGWTETPTGQTFADSPPGSPFYLWIERMASRGIISGYPCGGPFEPCLPPTNRPYFRPANQATRGQMNKIAAQTFLPNCQSLTQPDR